MAHSNGVITAPVGIDADIAPVLGVGSYDLGYLCSNAHGKINKWSYIKPKEANTPDFNMGDFSEIADCYFGVYGELLTPKGVSSSHKLDPDYVKLNEFAESVKQSYLKGYGEQ